MKYFFFLFLCLCFPLLAQEESEFLLSDEEAANFAEAIESTFIYFNLIGAEISQVTNISGSPHSSMSIGGSTPSSKYIPLTVGGDISIETQLLSEYSSQQEEEQQFVLANIEDVSLNINDIIIPTTAILSEGQITNILTSSSSTAQDNSSQDSRANGANFGGGASGGGGTGVSGINGKNEWQSLVLDGSKKLNINKRYLTILYGNDTSYWNEDYSIPLVSFDIGSLTYNNITLDDTYELEHGLNYQEFIENVYFPTLDSDFVYRLELNNGAVYLWAKLPDLPPIPEPKAHLLLLCSVFGFLFRKRH